VYLIGLTGGIASGKSTVARRLVEHGAIHLDADQLARRVVEPGSACLDAIVREFGEGVLTHDGMLDRQKLGEIVFRDEGARARLNAIVHPAVRELSGRLIAKAEQEDPDAVVVYDVPLLVEAQVDHPFDLIVVTSAPKRTQVERLVKERGLDPIQAEARVDAQVSDADRRAVADVVIDTGGSLAHTMSQADDLWVRIDRERRAKRAEPEDGAVAPSASLSAYPGRVSEGRPRLESMQSTRSVRPFQVVSEYAPSGDQPQAIADLAGRINAGETDVVLLGATGTGKSATTAWLIEQVQRPTLVLAHNKTLAAQLANEFRELMPNNAVEYVVSYYDYYQPEAYVPQTDTFIEKDSSINAEVERLRHSTTNSLLSRRDVVVVSTVSCIYGLGTPE